MKRIAIIGGGISGLVVLHYLKQRFANSADISLFEREASVGGTIRSFMQDGCLFEWGPNGFLDNGGAAALQLIAELGLSDQLMEANKSARRRYVQIKGQLRPVPSGPLALISTPLLSTADKLSLLAGIFKKGISTDRSIHEYVAERFSLPVAESLVDPLISGIYAGDIKRLHMGAAFPKFKGRGFKKSRMLSFKRGMGQIIEALASRYKADIRTNSEISTRTDADVMVIAAPAYAASPIVHAVNPVLARVLDQIPYAPLAVAGLVFNQDAFKKRPEGFGYLVPSGENKDILGVLIESNVYEARAGQGQIMLRVMLGGVHHPAIINDDHQTILAKASQEIDSIYGLSAYPVETFIKMWPKAIPQYELNYPSLRQSMAEQCAKTPGLYLCANYIDGISFNDCVRNARSLAGTVKI